MRQKRHRIQFPRTNTHELDQDKAHFFLQENDRKIKIRFHEYGEIYKRPGLYEQIFYDRLKCQSHTKVTQILKSSVNQTSDMFTQLRVIDLGAGNGMMGEALKAHGISRLVGVDIIQEAFDAVMRDRPDLYDDYYIEDFCRLTDEKREDIASWRFDCMVTVGALGFGDIPTNAFVEAFNIIENKGWIAFNIKETFFDLQDKTGFSRLIRELIFSEYLDIYHIERYRHRLSSEGDPLFYFALAGRKNGDIPNTFLESKGLNECM